MSPTTLSGIAPPSVPTIRMPRALWEKWDAALRSGEYPQTTGRLHVNEEFSAVFGAPVGYCCLGVLQMVADGQVEQRVDEPDRARALPTGEWLQAHQVETRRGKYYNWTTDSALCVGHHEGYPAESGPMVSVIALNDGLFLPGLAKKHRASFEQIADLVKNAVEFTEGGRP